MDRKKAKADAQEAKAKGAQSTALRDLAPIAREINTRWEQAQKLDAKADDHRLSVAIFLGQARERCDKARINFKKWCDANVSLAYETARKLVAIGQAPEPKVALLEYRARQARHQANARERGKKKGAVPSPSRASQGKVVADKPAPFVEALATVKAAPETARRSALTTIANSVGMVALPKDKADRLRAYDGDAPAAIVAAFKTLTLADQQAILQRLAGMIDARVTFAAGGRGNGGQAVADDGMPDIPDFLDRREKAGSKRKGARHA